jgi:hypothetical protein
MLKSRGGRRSNAHKDFRILNNQALLLLFLVPFTVLGGSRSELRGGSTISSVPSSEARPSSIFLLKGSAMPMTPIFVASHFFNSVRCRYPFTLNHSANRPSISLSSHFFPEGASYSTFSLYTGTCFFTDDCSVNCSPSVSVASGQNHTISRPSAGLPECRRRFSPPQTSKPKASRNHSVQSIPRMLHRYSISWHPNQASSRNRMLLPLLRLLNIRQQDGCSCSSAIA